MIPSSTHLSCNYSSNTILNSKLVFFQKSQSTANPIVNSRFLKHFYRSPASHLSLSTLPPALQLKLRRRPGGLQLCHNSLNSDNDNPQPPIPTDTGTRDWTTSILLFVLWAALMFYVFTLTPNQTPSRDMYFLEKLLNLKGDDGFEMNQVLVALWYIMGLWPVVYSMLLLPSGRSSNSKVPVWPFLVLSFFGGAYALLPYFVIWKPPPPIVEEAELGKWPLNLLESKLIAVTLIAAGLGIITYAGLANAGAWKEFYQYFRESKFIHVTCLDFTLLSTFAPFWIYNDMTARKWFDKGSWILPFTLIPFLGPAVYLGLRPTLSVSSPKNEVDND